MGQSNTCNVMCFILVLLLVVINTSSGENFLNKLGKNMSNMGSMFNSATSFSQDLSDWDVSTVLAMDYMF